MPLACTHAPTKREREASDIHYQLGTEALQAGRREEAMAEFGQAIQSNDQNAAAWLGRGVTYQYYGKLPEAERDYRRAIEIDPKLSDAHNALGQLLALTGRPQQALDEFDLALGDMLYRDAYLAHCNKGQALHALGRKEEGLAEMRTCLSLAPRYCRGHRDLARLQLEDGQLQAGLVSMRRYAELCPKVPDAWFQLGLAEMKAGHREKAREAFNKCLEIEGEDPVLDECRSKSQVLQ